MPLLPAYICPRCGAGHATDLHKEISPDEMQVRCKGCRRKYKLVKKAGIWKPELIPGLKKKRFGVIGRSFNA